ncbi:MAG: hypothetical protein MPN21_18220 [Thermoanaerobaculia bacterium]|nr:hypothetical protein [Thermoanaerobaculia bacterium]
MTRLAYVVSSHGFGHAARACAVIEALWNTNSGREVHVTIFGRTPEWFFHQSLGPPGDPGSYEVVPADTDVGLVQTSALREDASATARLLRERPPVDRGCPALTDAISASDSRCVACDISPWGITAAERLGLPSLLVENFTWDWIYAGYPQLRDFVEPMHRAFSAATRHVQTEPVCRTDPTADCVTSVVSRTARTTRRDLRAALGVGDEEALVMMTMGGITWSYENLEGLSSEADRVWLIAGGTTEPTPERRGRHVLLPHRSPFFHPDLVGATDLVVGKLGYSTVAEVATAGTRFAYVPRPLFPESERLEAWTRTHLTAQRIEPEDLESPSWLSVLTRHVDDLLRRPRRGGLSNGAPQVAEQILSMLRDQ